ncbi:hypothetical protein ACFL05_00535 [Patescibacteria group bacterium]
MNQTTKWIIGIIIIVAIAWYGYTSTQETNDVIDVNDTVEMADAEVDPTIDPTEAVQPEIEGAVDTEVDETIDPAVE